MADPKVSYTHPQPPPPYSADGFPAPYPGPGPSAVTTQHVTVAHVMVAPALGDRSTHVTCPHCHAQVLTRTETKAGVVPWLSGGVICLMGGIFGCCLIPCCIPACMDVEHSCPNCGTYIGRRSAFQ